MRTPDMAALPHGEIHVWHVTVDAAADLSALSADERTRAAAFRQPADRARFSAARSALRAILGHCLGMAPDAVPLVANAFGKPTLGSLDTAAPPLQFNVSHSGARAVIALSREPVGIDIEAWRADMAWAAWHDSAAVACTPGEMRWLSALAQRQPQDAMLAFLRLWTAKEACSKAVGTGLSASPQSVRVALPPCAAGVPPLARAEADLRVWHIHDARGLSDCDTRYVASLATPLPAARVVHRQYRPRELPPRAANRSCPAPVPGPAVNVPVQRPRSTPR
ncbi:MULTISPECIES: 4'-phosphopantetheinyl transferase family protein [Cupriavidus]|uniref:4'-phosphopantetheinyl transferase family protein n=1 Tax=Cupriavidus sp. DF5525 TaxID=3160989 RepID=UPI0003B04D7A|nr:hypothetical protein N234_30120 [Ralstonia pickettii DTP0602]